MPSVGVVVPAWNAGRYLADTLRSVQRQTRQDWECIVVDDGSTDDTLAIAHGFAGADPRFRVISQRNGGPHIARNTGLAAVAPGVRWVALLDSDDTWLEDALDQLLIAAGDRPDAVGVYGLAEFMDADGDPVRPGAHPAAQRDRRRLGTTGLVGVPPEEDSSFETLVVSGTIWPPAVGIFRRDVVDLVGAFDPMQRLGEDWDLYLRMSRHGPFVPVARQVAWYRQHPANLTKRAEEMAYFLARVRWRAWSSPSNTARQRRTARRVWRQVQLRWIVWTLGHVPGGLRDRDPAALVATARFVRQLLVGHPSEPGAETAQAVVRFVDAHQRGEGLREGWSPGD